MAPDLMLDIAKLLARLTIGGLLLFHGAHFLRGDRQIFEIVKQNGLPEPIAYGAILGEVVAPVCAILGIYTRAAGLLMALFLVAGIALFHRGHLFMLSAKGDSYYLELQVFFLSGGLMVMLLGAGPFGFGIGGAWN